MKTGHQISFTHLQPTTTKIIKLSNDSATVELHMYSKTKTLAKCQQIGKKKKEVIFFLHFTYLFVDKHELHSWRNYRVCMLTTEKSMADESG